MSWKQPWLPYRQMQKAPGSIIADRTEGVRIHLKDGRTLIDGIGSWWTACHGYNHPHIKAAVIEQLNQMPHIMLGGLVHEPVLRLTDRLVKLLPGQLNHVFYSESGSVSIEIAMKMALQYWTNKGIKGRTRFLSFRDGYHGDTFGAMSVCDPEDGMHHLFQGVLADQIMVDLPRDKEKLIAFESVVANHANELAGVMVEPLVQAAAGMRFHEPETLAAIADIAKRYGLLLILDEIATGFGRTGALFAFEEATIEPDIIALSKALTGGTMPLAATVATEKIYEAFLSDDYDKALMHGPTFSGNPLGCAAANASLDLFEREPRLSQAMAIEAQLKAGLTICEDFPAVVDVRVKGAVGVVQFERCPNINVLRERFISQGVWVRPFRDVIYLMPALVINSNDLNQLIDSVILVARDAFN
ncbi:MAG: adenosylmethionine--8-amino-7-oxononanoate transaminase [Rhodospirillaceae bacterium]|nr:adenosylmethionine--8-amino-7-oxononanoate transaminase [Rhodospirillaceae bacterium]|tara:strand:- start:6497 stop:7741 length:1245 start_codon:yes stop_codon:yes gene_type:complete